MPFMTKKRISNLFSVRNMLRVSGVFALSAGAPMALAPGLGVLVFFGKRASSSQADKNVLKVLMRALGLALVSSGTKSVVAPASKPALAAALAEQAVFMCMHVWLRAFGVWKEADARMIMNTLFMVAHTGTVAAQTTVLVISDAPDEQQEKPIVQEQ